MNLKLAAIKVTHFYKIFLTSHQTSSWRNEKPDYNLQNIKKPPKWLHHLHSKTILTLTREATGSLVFRLLPQASLLIIVMIIS